MKLPPNNNHPPFYHATPLVGLSGKLKGNQEEPAQVSAELTSIRKSLWLPAPLSRHRGGQLPLRSSGGCPARPSTLRSAQTLRHPSRSLGGLQWGQTPLKHRSGRLCAYSMHS